MGLFLKKSTAHFWSWGNNLGSVESLLEEMVKRRTTFVSGPLKKFNLRSKSGYGFAVLLSNFARTFLQQLFAAQLIMTGKLSYSFLSVCKKKKKDWGGDQ